MEIKKYQKAVSELAIYPGSGTGSTNALSYCSLGLAGEAGEVANKAKKILRDDKSELTEAKRVELYNELGDVAWYLAQMCNELGLSLHDVLENNLKKLESRKKKGSISGSGDNR